MEMEIPVINLEELEGERRGTTMLLLREACEKFGFFKVSNHGIDDGLMEKLTKLVNLHYEEHMKESFYKSEMAEGLETRPRPIVDGDWETSFFVHHLPTSNVEGFISLSYDLREAIQEYVSQMIKLAEKLLELMSENLGLDKGYLKNTFSGGGKASPSVGTKIAKYPNCPRPDMVNGLRAHTDAGGIILLLQDDAVPGLEFFKEGKWTEISPSKTNTIFINTGDQLEVMSNGRYPSTLHRVVANAEGSRLSIATFYNPASEAIVSPAPDLRYPHGFRFGDYLDLYATTKFVDKGSRFESLKNNGYGHGQP